MSFTWTRGSGEQVMLANANVWRPQTARRTICLKEGAGFENLQPTSDTCDYARTGIWVMLRAICR